ncbi:hypothetical protein IYW40_04665 [Methylocystis sp. H4A]|uniref:hypothetical protein n=1 Tax=Methylocystis sp. H4A TaxID=2785788 RepID=UPI0018C2C36D|nr:hypothetical protein [Methylocystis sp. H4A]MBG0800786.1 hypothetical protein [Methylocystis sp. H4A]
MNASAERARLRDAIADQTRAQEALEEAQRAAANARDRFFAASRKADQLAAQIEETAQQPPDKFIEALAGDLDVIIDSPVAELRKELEAAEAQLTVWGAARTVAEDAIETRRKALDLAQYFVDGAARRVVEAETNVAAALCACEALRSELLDSQSRIAAIAGSVDCASEQRKRLDAFLTDSWLIDAPWRNRPAGQQVKDAFAALKNDAAAKMMN